MALKHFILCLGCLEEPITGIARNLIAPLQLTDKSPPAPTHALPQHLLHPISPDPLRLLPPDLAAVVPVDSLGAVLIIFGGLGGGACEFDIFWSIVEGLPRLIILIKHRPLPPKNLIRRHIRRIRLRQQLPPIKSHFHPLTLQRRRLKPPTTSSTALLLTFIVQPLPGLALLLGHH